MLSLKIEEKALFNNSACQQLKESFTQICEVGVSLPVLSTFCV